MELNIDSDWCTATFVQFSFLQSQCTIQIGQMTKVLSPKSVYSNKWVRGQSYYLPDQCIVKIVSKDKVIIY